MLLTKELDAAFDRKEYKNYFDWFMEKALLLKKIANQYNTDWSEHGGVQNPCYRSIVSNTDTFEIQPVVLLALWLAPISM